MKWGITSRFAVIFSLLVLLATGTVGYMVYQAVRQSLIDSATDRLSYTASTIEVRLSASVEAISNDVRFLASTPPVQGIIRAAQRRGFDPEMAMYGYEWQNQLTDIFEVFMANRPAYYRVRFIGTGRSGRELVRTERRNGQIIRIRNKSLQAIDVSSRFDRTSKSYPENVTISELTTQVTEMGLVPEGTPVLHASIPVVDRRDRVFGFIEISVDFTENLHALVELTEPDRSLYLINSKGEVVITPDLPGKTRNAPDFSIVKAIPQINALLNGNINEIETEQVEFTPGNPMTAYFRRISYDRGTTHEELVVGITSPHAQILEKVRHVRDRSVLITLLFSLAGIVLAMSFAGFLTRPLSQVTQAISDFGKKGWTASLHMNRKDEIGILARTFSTMAAQIQSQLAELEDKERRQRIILDTSADGIVVIDATGNIESFNPSAERIFGYSETEMVGRPFSALISSTYEGDFGYFRLVTDDEDSEGKKEAIGGHEISGIRKDGELFPLAIASSAFEFHGEWKYAAFLQDITERRRYEEALYQAKNEAEEMARLKSAFLANMSHEIRTPLTSVIGYASILAKEVGDKHKRFAQLIERSGRRLMDTLNSVLSLAQLEAGRVQVQFEDINVVDEIHEIVQLYDQTASQKNLQLKTIIDPDAQLLRSRLDRGALSSIMQNLIGNAVKFTPSGEIAVLVDQFDRQVRIRVRDTGVGIEASFLPYLFDEFRQESVGFSRSHEGNGLGLAITKRLVDRLGGHISAESEKGKGSTFTVLFPLLIPEAESKPAPAPTIDPGIDFSKANIMLIEDNPETAYLILHILLDVCNVTLASSCEEALRKAGKKQIDAVLLDINLGKGENGIDVLHHLRELPGYRELPAAALTAYALPGDKERFLAEGFNRYLAKPFTVEGLLNVATQLLGPQQSETVVEVTKQG